jgi:hypothetical protein
MVVPLICLPPSLIAERAVSRETLPAAPRQRGRLKAETGGVLLPYRFFLLRSED